MTLKKLIGIILRIDVGRFMMVSSDLQTLSEQCIHAKVSIEVGRLFLDITGMNGLIAT